MKNVLLALVLGLGATVIGSGFGKTKEKTEEVFVETIGDALDIYLSSNSVRSLFGSATRCSSMLSKTHGDVNVYRVSTTFQSVIDSEYKPIGQKDLVNPADKEKNCANASDIEITIYRDSDYVYYYSVDKSEFDCLKNIGGDYESVITNLPKIDSNEDGKIDDKDDYFVCG